MINLAVHDLDLNVGTIIAIIGLDNKNRRLETALNDLNDSRARPGDSQILGKR